MDSKKNINAKVDKILPHAEGFNRNDVLQLLQENDLDVERTISDFADGRASALLSHWEAASVGKSAKRKNKNNKSKEMNHNEGTQPTKHPVVNGVASENENRPKPVKNKSKTAKNQKKPVPNHGIENPKQDNVVNDPHTASVVLKHMLTNQSSNEPAVSKAPDAPPPLKDAPIHRDSAPQSIEANKKPSIHDSHDLSRVRTTSESSSKTKANQRNRSRQKPTQANNATDKQRMGDSEQMRVNAMHNRKTIEKAVRDLQRCSVSFGRHRTLLNEEFEESYKKLKQVFEEITNAAIDREVELMRMLDVRKEDALGLLTRREARANQLKKMIERVDSMSPQQVNELRNDVKHFVSERKFEEELGKSVRFNCDRDVVTNVLPHFGELLAVKNLSVGHHRERYESTASDVSSSIPPLVDDPLPSAPVQHHKISPLAKDNSHLAASKSTTQKSAPAPQRNNSAPQKSNPPPQKSHPPPQKSHPPPQKSYPPPPRKSEPVRKKSNPPQKSAPPPEKSDPEQTTLPPHRSTSWADSEDSHLFPENRASWAVDTPLVSSNGVNADEEKSSLPKPKRNRNRRYRNEDNAGSNELDKNQSSSRGQNFSKKAPNSPEKAAGDANTSVKQDESRSGDGASRDYVNRNRDYYPRGRGGFRGAPRGRFYPRGNRGGYRNDHGGYRNDHGGYRNYPMNQREGDGNRYTPRNNPRRNEDFESSSRGNIQETQKQDINPSAKTTPKPDSHPQRHSSDSAPPKSPKKENKPHAPPSNPANEEPKSLPPRNNQRYRNRRNQASNENEPRDAPTPHHSQQTETGKPGPKEQQE